jgi:hypothetical protein
MPLYTAPLPPALIGPKKGPRKRKHVGSGLGTMRCCACGETLDPEALIEERKEGWTHSPACPAL